MKRTIMIVLALVSGPAFADRADVAKPGGGIINRQTGAETWPYRGELGTVRPYPMQRDQRAPWQAEATPMVLPPAARSGCVTEPSGKITCK